MDKRKRRKENNILWEDKTSMSLQEQLAAAKRYATRRVMIADEQQPFVNFSLLHTIGIWLLSNVFIFVLIARLGWSYKLLWLLAANVLFVIGFFLFLYIRLRIFMAQHPEKMADLQYSMMQEEAVKELSKEELDEVLEDQLLLTGRGLTCGQIRYGWAEIEYAEIYENWLYIKTFENDYAPISLKGIREFKINSLKRILAEKNKLFSGEDFQDYFGY